MNKKEVDISQIRKYLNGELNAHAMHQLERQAQDDPFLMDALEGYESAGTDQQKNLDILAERLGERVARNEKKIIPWRIMTIAASVLVVATVGGLLLFNRGPKNNNQIAVAIKPPVRIPVDTPQQAEHTTLPPAKNEVAAVPLPKKTVLRPVTVADAQVENAPVAMADTASTQQMALADVKMGSARVADKDTATPLNEMVVLGYSAQTKKQVKFDKNGNADLLKKAPVASSSQLLQSKVPGVSVTLPNRNEDRTQEYLSKTGATQKPVETFNRLPVPANTGKITGTNNAQTTQYGHLSPRADTVRTGLANGNAGFKAQILKNIAPDTAKRIAATSPMSLSEVVVAPVAKESPNDKVVKKAHPKQGWESFKKYLDQNATSADGVAGTVKLSFIVSPDGNISGLKIIESVSTATDQKALKLIITGPAWTGSNTGKPEKVILKIKFSK